MAKTRLVNLKPGYICGPVIIKIMLNNAQINGYLIVNIVSTAPPSVLCGRIIFQMTFRNLSSAAK